MHQPAIPPSPLPPQASLHRTARLARWLVLAGGALFTLNAVGMWLFPGYALHIVQSQTQAGVIGPLTLRTRVMLALWDLPSLAVILMALLRLWQLFGEYLQGRVFSARALASLRGFARWVLAAAFLSPVYRAVLSVLVTLQNGPGKRELTINLSSDDYLMLLIGVVLLAISSVMAEAARIAEDNEGFV
jgi:hypothetical protein